MNQNNKPPDYRPRIAVVDFGAGNLRSVVQALRIVGAEALITDRADEIASADGVVFPGDGAARSAFARKSPRGAPSCSAAKARCTIACDFIRD